IVRHLIKFGVISTSLLIGSLLLLSISGMTHTYGITTAQNSVQPSFGSTMNLSNNAGSSEVPVVAANGSNVYIAWHDDTPGKLKTSFRASHDNGITFGPTIQFLGKAAAHQVRIF